MMQTLAGDGLYFAVFDEIVIVVSAVIIPVV
jgi:hypothetical protein